MTLAEVLNAAADQFDPSDGIDLLGMLITITPSIIAAIGVIIVGVLTVRGQKKGAARAGKIDAKTNEIHEQTVNDHRGKSNMRDDVDEIRDLLKAVSDRQISQGHDIRGLRTDVGELRGEDRAARTEHDDLVRRLNAFIRREHPGADPL
ncbi:DUF2746 domain-containing protein [Mycolicibacterium fortuitum]|uniref:DUF2746 domain-containing protein n=1 Tax=Mycolicibacterium fortuitum TaxID=1766 RepID=UPI0007E93BE8|nr:DUF2746 domain-containing protein [Mycolicibacterium fortuitum]MDG5773971.1 DUF2746 domain-containing protein [Mycolicibacterium fortuitum]MDG5779643.1 DUF2746 domain-containing protein [Mycolicibacterium fortuitum]OBB42479.1 hypothetical protein A5754_14650 [Mycolicibacterium fortuitum]OBB54599.1 hypothetical protein A5755_30185 [Mycolicibacterium fortuitum]OBF66824.1 hypothetical protein A5751_02075 [Mycolicibacterium fortuitum]